MIYLSGGLPTTLMRLLERAERDDLGLLLTPTSRMRKLYGAPWAADNECFTKGDVFDDNVWLMWLESSMAFSGSCLFAAAPDVVGDARATLYRSRPYLEEIRALAYAPAFVSQDGATDALMPWDEFDCLFVGGSTEWKFSEPSVALIQEAKRRDKWVHVGRVNSLRRMMTAHSVGADSADGTYLAFGPDKNLPKLLRWLDATNAQLPLEAV